MSCVIIKTLINFKKIKNPCVVFVTFGTVEVFGVNYAQYFKRMFKVFSGYKKNCLFKVRILREEYAPAPDNYDKSKIIVSSEHMPQQDILGNYIIIFI